VALVCAAVAPILGAPAGGLEGTISQTFAQITRSAARQTRTEVENLTDALTGLYNHRYFHERLEGEVQAARERQDALSVLLCDVDGFSRINDAHGHAVGDEVLRTLAQTVSSSIRRVDVAARYAGDQIAVLLAGVAAAEAADVAERVRADVASAAAALRVGNVAISVGVASLPAHASTRRDLLEAARAAVDTAKQRGGNEVVVFAAPAGKEARGLRSQHPKDSTQPLASR
jgi:diguanylate cyclase (GGDEF)-like protein